MVGSYNGYYGGFVIRSSEFDSLTNHKLTNLRMEFFMSKKQKSKTLAEALFFNKYVGDFSCMSDIKKTFGLPDDALRTCTILFAECDEGGWEGTAAVRFYDHTEEKFYEVNAWHCSCYGFDGEWNPEEIGDLEMYIKYCERKNLEY